MILVFLLTYLIDKAFRHGDIENVLQELVKCVSAGIGGGSLLRIASSVLQEVTGGSKFSKSDIKKVYFVSNDCVSIYNKINFSSSGKLVERLLSGLFLR